MPTFAPLSVPTRHAWLRLGLLGLALAGGLPAQDWQPLLANPPFGQVAVAGEAAPAANELEFRGVVVEDGTSFVNLFNPTTRTSQWVPVNGQAGGMEVKAYSAREEKVEVTVGTKTLTLPLKQARIVLAKFNLPPPPQPHEEASDNPDLEERRARIREMIRARAESPDPNQTMRNLPPEAQAMMDEFRRRRAERANATVNGEAQEDDAPAKQGSPQRKPPQP